ncbi:MAG: hypothetical protein HS104_30415 [Polyangiaceae bacterium]|nr:hypothetical protein [Polyangiaceae bacterium]MCL4755618.1 hypothetical protein [Myxococcales bacterium]
MPAEYGLRLDQKNGALPVSHETRQENHHASLVRLELRLSERASSDDELLAQKRILGDQLLASAERILDQTGDERRWTDCRATGGVQAPQHAGDDPSNPATELSQHERLWRSPRAVQVLFAAHSREIMRRMRLVARTRGSRGRA